MKCEEISDALGLLEEGMICHALMVRRKRKKTSSNRNKIWKVRYVVAASLCLVCTGVAAVWSVLQFGAEGDLPQ